ncbi:hypothetical protein ACFLVU_05880 [Chloroflexota bacterium]
MGKKQLESTLQLQRIAAIPYNPNLRRDIELIRIKYGLDKYDGDEAWKWYAEQINPVGVRSTLHYLVAKPDWDVRSYMEHPFETDIDIEQDIGTLLSRYQLPISQFIQIIYYATYGYPYSLEMLKAFKPGVLKVYSVQIELGRVEIIIGYLTPWTTKKEWNEIWDKDVLPIIKDLKQTQGIKLQARKATLFTMITQIERWSEWYELSEIQGLGPTKALREWEKINPTEAGKFDQSTVTHAVKEFERIITPIPA